MGLIKRLALGFASCGLAISVALTLSHLSQTPLPCGGGSGCEQVAHDPSSQLFGIPVSAFGIVGYLLLMLCAVLSLRGVRIAVQAGRTVAILGTIVSAWLTYHSITAIHATCLWCLGSAIMMVSCMTCFSLSRETPFATKPAGLKEMGPWIVVPLLAIGWLAYFGEGKQQAALKEYTVDYTKVSYDLVASTSHPYGTQATPIVIAEFGDLMCPACREMHEHVMTFQAKFPAKVSLLFHHFPLTGEVGHELSRYAANLSDQLDTSDFWQFVGSVYGSEEKPDKAALDKLFAACKGKRVLTPAQAEASVGKAIEVGKQYGVKMTPTYILFIDKKPVAFATSANLAQVLSQSEFRAVIEPGK